METKGFRIVMLISAMCIALLAPNIAQADVISVQFNGNAYGGIRTLTGIPPTNHSETVYVGPYGLYVPKGTLPQSLWMCFDATANVTSGQTWSALQTDTQGAKNLGWYSSSVISEIAWLTTQWSGNVYSLPSINEAMWEIMTPSIKDGSGFQTEVDSILMAASSHTTDFANAQFLIPVLGGSCEKGSCVPDPNRPQPFAAPVPEPGTLLLLGTGLIGAAGFSRRFFRRK